MRLTEYMYDGPREGPGGNTYYKTIHPTTGRVLPSSPPSPEEIEMMNQDLLTNILTRAKKKAAKKKRTKKK